MLTLRSEHLLVVVDPAHGGEILGVTDRCHDRPLLGRPPFAAAAAAGGDLAEARWTASYRGGWQLATPNAGAACTVDGAFHGFHGRASNDPWTVQAHAEASAVLAWTGHGLEIERSITLDGRTVVARTAWTARDVRTPFVVAEHVALGAALLDPEVRLELPGGRAWATDAAGGPALAPPQAEAWPRCAGLGAGDRADRWCLADAGTQYLMVADLPVGRAQAVNARTGACVLIEWDVEVMPHLWIWREARATGGVWGRRGEIVGLEPASVAHGLGLAEAVAHRQAHWLEPGASRTSTTRLTSLGDCGLSP